MSFNYSFTQQFVFFASPHLLPAGTSHEVDLVLLLLHALDILLQAGNICFAVGGLEAEQLGQTGPVGVVLNDTKLDVGSKLLPEFIVVLFLCDLLDHVQSLTHQLLTDNLNVGQFLFSLIDQSRGIKFKWETENA